MAKHFENSYLVNDDISMYMMSLTLVVFQQLLKIC